MTKFSFLLDNPERVLFEGRIHIGGSNYFYHLKTQEIEDAEKMLGYSFPSELREFYEKIGYGCFIEPHNPPPDYVFYNSNEILPPMVTAKFSKGELLWEGQSYWMAESTLELLSPGDLPFFEIGDSTRFLVMKLNSDNPNAVWHQGFGDFKVEDSFERFIWRLYYEDPGFYDDMIDEFYKNNPQK